MGAVGTAACAVSLPTRAQKMRNPHLWIWGVTVPVYPLQVKVQAVPVLQEEGTTITSAAHVLARGAVWAVFVLVSTLLCAADNGVVSTSVRQPQITRCSLSAGGWSRAPHKMICLVSLWLLLVQSPKPPPPRQCNAINWMAASGNCTFLHFLRELPA